MQKTAPAQKPRYILIIEDNVHHAELLTELLDRHFAPVIIHTVDTYADGMDFLTQSSYDLILSTAFIGSDAIVDRIGDFISLAAGTPLMVIAGRGDEALAARLSRHGVAEYLVKTPETLDLLADVIKKQLQKSKRRAGIHPSTPATHTTLPRSNDLKREMEKFREEVKDTFSSARLYTEQSQLPDEDQIERLQSHLAHIRHLVAQKRAR